MWFGCLALVLGCLKIEFNSDNKWRKLFVMKI